jgi:hypothetical protein
MNDPIELPSLEEVEQMEQWRSKAIEALEISDGTDLLAEDAKYDKL